MKNFFTLLLFTGFLLLHSYSSFSQKAKWNPLTNFPGGQRTGAFGFTIGNKFYFGGGVGDGGVKSDFWEYNVPAGVWTRKADYGGGPRYFGFAFSVGSKGYAGTGAKNPNADTLSKDFWEYDPAKNKWTRRADFAGGIRQQAFAAATATKGYAGTGLSGKEVTSVKNDFWEYDPAKNKWIKKRNLPGFFNRFGATAFVINGKIYAGTGVDNLSRYTKDFFQYSPSSNRWSRKAKFGGTGVLRAVGFAIGTTGYLGTGYDGKDYRDEFWAYNSLKNKWTKTTTFPGKGRIGAVGFSYKGLGYLISGSSGGLFADLWKFTPAAAGVVAVEYEEAMAAVSSSTVKIFPNPAATQFTITMNAGEENKQTSALIYDMQGRIAAKHDFGTISGNISKTINVAALPAGMYKVVIVQGTNRETVSLLIAR